MQHSIALGGQYQVAVWRLESLFPVLVSRFAGSKTVEGLDAVSKVVCSILTSRRSIKRLATASKPLAYLQRCVRNTLRHKPPKKELWFRNRETQDASIIRETPCDLLLRKELSMEIARLLETLRPVKRDVVRRWMHDETYPEIAQARGISEPMARYHVSSGLARLRKEVLTHRSRWRLILTESGRSDCTPLSA
jgi:RNA polymerase sigma factor (sigma-70 family)